MSIVLQGSTSGSITLQEPAVAGSTVLSLPATSGTLITTGSTGQVIPKAALPTGSVLQVVQTAPIANLITTSTSYVNFSDLNTSITPTSASSKILIIAGALNIYNGAANANMQITLYRNSTNLGGANGYFFYAYGSTTINLSLPQTITYLDSPATTSSITYGVYGKTSSGSMSFNNGNSQLSMVLMEIAA